MLKKTLSFCCFVFILTTLMASLSSCKKKVNINTTDIVYPATAKVDSSRVYFGTKIETPYVWLEDLNSQATKQWVSDQNKCTDAYINAIPYRKTLEEKLASLWNFERYSIPFKRGDYLYYFKNNGLQNQSILYRKNAQQAEEVFLDPNTFSADGTTSLAGVKFSEDETLVAYSISEGGSDWQKVITMNVQDKKIIDTLTNVKFSSTAWASREGFYYSTYENVQGNALSSKTSSHHLMFHRLGSPQKNDQLIFGGKPNEEYRYVSGYVTEDGKYLFIYASQTTYGRDVYVKDLQKPNAKLMPISLGISNDYSVVYAKGNSFWVVTDWNAPNSKLMKFTFGNTDKSKWETIIPEADMPLDVSFSSGYFFASYLNGATYSVKQFDTAGKMVREIELPDLGSVAGFSGKEKDEKVYYSFTNHITPSTNYELDPVSGKSTIINQAKLQFSSNDYVSKQILYTSTDGQKIPMTISHRKDLDLSKAHPLLLYGYGGFSISITPHFSPRNLMWMQMGGIYAVPNIRGGGEYGEKWHIAGTKQHKKQVFEDFIAAAKYLIDNQLTTNQLLAIEGGSNGGLLVGACMTMRPDLFKVALPAVGVLDMLKYHEFTAGAGWAYDYGRADESKEMFQYLLSYSPLHNVKAGTCYPATLVTTADHDDRVVPSHSYKFISALQAAQSCKKIPTFISIQTNVGHGAGKSTKLVIRDESMKIAFTLWNLGVTDLP